MHYCLITVALDMSAIIEQLQFVSKKSWLPRLVSALIIFLFLWWAASRIMPLFGDDNAGEAALAKKNASEKITTAQEKSSLNQLNLFGASKQDLTRKQTTPAKITKLRLTLKGIFATSDPKQGAVQIQNDRQQESNFTVGESIFGKATLEEIYSDRIILYRNGQYETLMLPGKSLNAKYFSVAKQTTRKTTKQASNQPATSQSIISKQTISTQAIFTPQSEKQQLPEHTATNKITNNNTNKQKIADDYRTIAISGSGEILRDLFIFNTAWKQGNFIGFIIKARNDKGLKMMHVLGIKNHDLITVVNGLRFSEKLESPEQLEKLKTATSIDVIFERDGKEIPFHFDFDTPITNLGS